MKILGLLLISTWLARVSADLYSAVEELESLSVNDEKLKVEYHKLIAKLEETIALVKKKVAKIEVEQEIMNKDSIGYVSNPLNAFLLLKRLSIDVLQVEDSILKIADDFKETCGKIKVTSEDFEGVAEGLTRLQTLYGLKTEDLSNGIIQGQKYRKNLTAEEIFSFGVYLMNTKRFVLSLSYLNLALEKNEKTFDMPSMVILGEILRNHNSTGNRPAMIETFDKMLTLEPERRDLDLEKLKIELLMILEDNQETENVDGEKKTEVDTAIEEFKMLAKTCTGEATQSPEELSVLCCRYSSKSAFSKIAPFKLEEANLNPYIVIFHEVISDADIEVFKSESRPSLKRATVHNKDQSLRLDGVRVSKHSWHGDDNHNVFKKMTQRVIDMTGLNRENFEEWQTQNYGIGGYYIPHHDYDDNQELPFGQRRGNRIATMMLYLSDVERGGATAFPYLRIKIQPKKGTAVFWYNLSTSGHLEYYTRHAACPVLVGSKWVANKWIRAFHQEWTRPCQLFPMETDQYYFRKFF